MLLLSVLLLLLSNHTRGVVGGIDLRFSLVFELINEQSLLVVRSMLLLHPVDLDQGFGK